MIGITYREAKDAFLAYCRTKNLSRHTVGFYSQRLEHTIGTLLRKYPGLAPQETNVGHLRECISESIESSLSVKTVNHDIVTLKTFFSFLHEEGFVGSDPTVRLSRLKSQKRLVGTFQEEQIQDLLSAPDRNRFSGVRDYAIMALLLDTGLRVSEAISLSISEIDFSHGTVRVVGKGNKERLVPFGKRVRRFLMDYLERRGELPETDRVFVNEYGEPFAVRSFQDNFAEYGRKAGVTGVRVSPHTCRHTFAKTWITGGGDVFSLQQILGHTSMDMVREYVSLASEDVSRAHRVYSPMDKLLTRDQESMSDKKKRKRLR